MRDVCQPDDADGARAATGTGRAASEPAAAAHAEERQPDSRHAAARSADRCLQLAPGTGPAPASAVTEPANNRFVLNDVKKDAKVSPDTGTSAAAAASAATFYRLEALESQLTPFLNTRVELSGGVKPPLNGSPVLLVEFVRKIARKCQ